MSNLKRLMSMVLATAMVLTIFVGCAKKSDDSKDQNQMTTQTSAQETSEATVEEDPFKEQMEISIGIWDAEQGVPQGANDPMYDQFKKKFNVTIKPITESWDNWWEQTTVWAASGQLPDLFYDTARSDPKFINWVKDGVVKAFPDDLSKYPTLGKIVSSPAVQALKAQDGKLYCYPISTYSNRDNMGLDKAIIIRKDWMEKVGITNVPQNMDEFIALMKAFVEKDPDGNGKNDTLGLTAYNSGYINSLFISYSPGVVGGSDVWIQEDGKWIPSGLSKTVLSGIKEIRRLYDSGGLDKDFVLLKGDEGVDKFAAGKAGALAWAGTPDITQRIIGDKWTKVFPDKKLSDSIVIMKPWKSADGTYNKTQSSGLWGEAYMNGQIDDKKSDRILRILDWMSSQEGMELTRFGIKDVDYKKDGDMITVTREKKSDGTFVTLLSKYPFMKAFYCMVTWDQDFYFVDPGFDDAYKNMAQEAVDFINQNGKLLEVNYGADYMVYPSKSKMTAQFGDDFIKALLSKDVEKTWNGRNDNLLKNGYADAIKEVNDLIAQSGK